MPQSGMGCVCGSPAHGVWCYSPSPLKLMGCYCLYCATPDIWCLSPKWAAVFLKLFCSYFANLVSCFQCFINVFQQHFPYLKTFPLLVGGGKKNFHFLNYHLFYFFRPYARTRTHIYTHMHVYIKFSFKLKPVSLSPVANHVCVSTML